MKVHCTIPTITMKFFDDEEADFNRHPYHGCLQWELIETLDNTVTATSACWHADMFSKTILIEIGKILYHDFNVRRVLSLRPRNKFIPGWRHVESGTFNGFSELILPDDLPEVLNDA